MATVADHTDCERCGYPALRELYTRSGEEFVTCQFCGWGYEIYIQEQDGDYRLDDQGHYVYDIIRKKPFGVFYIFHSDGFGEFRLLEEPITEEVLRSIKNELKETPEVDHDATYLSRWNEEKEKVEFLIGKERKTPSF